MAAVYPNTSDDRSGDDVAELNLAARLARDWAAAVVANREQVERVREQPQRADHYAPLARAFRADPHRRDDDALNALLEFARPDDTWLDIGAGAGRFAFALALRVAHVITVEPSQAMRAEFDMISREYGIENITLLDERWPRPEPSLVDAADVALIAHVGYDIEAMGELLDAMEIAAKRECAALMYERSPGSLFHELWPAIHGEPQAHLPALQHLLALLRARGAEPTVTEIPSGRWRFASHDEAEDWARRRLWLEPDSARIPTLRAGLAALLIRDGDRLTLPDAPKQVLVRWSRPTRNERNDP